MSIWGSWESVGFDDFGEGVSTRGGEVRSYATGWSNHYPTPDVELPAHVGIAHIPTWCVPGHRGEEGADDFPVGPWVRLDVVTHDYADCRAVSGPWAHSVVMDEGAARQLAADLIRWADSPKVQPEDAP